jgi:hypothetical protein
MLYATDERLFRYQVAEYAGIAEAPRIWVGLGSWLFAGDPARAVAQMRLVQSHPPLGLALFSWDSIQEAPALRDALADAAAPPAPMVAPAAAPEPGAAPSPPAPVAAPAAAATEAAPAEPDPTRPAPGAPEPGGLPAPPDGAAEPRTAP